MAARPHLGAVRERVGDVSDQRACLRVDLASLLAEAPVDAVRTVAEAAVGDRNRPDPHIDAEGVRPADEHVAVAPHRVGVLGVAVRVPPRPVLAGDRQLLLDVLVVRLEVLVADRPVGPHPVGARRPEVGRVQPRDVAGVVDHRPPDAPTAVVRPERYRVGTADLPRLVPEQGVRATLVADPVRVRVPKRSGVEGGYPPAGPCQALDEDAATSPRTDHDQVDLVLVGEAAHVAAQGVVGPRAVVRQQPGGLITLPQPGVGVAGAQRKRHSRSLHPPLPVPGSDAVSVSASVRRSSRTRSLRRRRARSKRSVAGTGSTSSWSRTSHRSRASSPMFL